MTKLEIMTRIAAGLAAHQGIDVTDIPGIERFADALITRCREEPFPAPAPEELRLEAGNRYVREADLISGYTETPNTNTP